MATLHRRLYEVCSTCHAVFPIRLTVRCASAAVSQVQADFLKGVPHRKHPGVTNLKIVCLPEALQRAALSLIHKSEVKELTERARNLTNYLWSRKRAVEAPQLREKAVALEKKWLERENDWHNDGGGVYSEDHIRKKVLSELRRMTYRWTPLRYNAELGVVYMAARLAGGYAAITRALNEIKKRDLSFAPHTFLDFGSGLGTALWASHAVWGDSLKEYVCVDTSGAMNTLAEQLLMGNGELDDPHVKQVYFRQFLPVSPKVQSDLVVAAFSLSELASLKDRQEAVLTLWRKTNGYLVLVENGTKEGHQILMEARDVLLKAEEKVVHDFQRPTVFAPCPHQLICPKLATQPTVPCNFLQPYRPLPLPSSAERQQEKFSYLIVSRGDVQEPGQGEGLEWSRAIAPVHRRPRHVQCHICCSSGELRRLAVTARHHGRDMYRCARISDWGDLLPIIHIKENEETDDPCD